jgi:hypothetical protein
MTSSRKMDFIMQNEKEKFYCRKCMKYKGEDEFYDAVDNGLIDTNKKLSVCKTCINDLYSKIYDETGSLEKTLHRLCISLNVKYSNDAADAAKANIRTLLENGKNVTAVFGLYKQKLISVNPSMDKSVKQDLTYEDMGVIFTEKQSSTTELPIPDEVAEFWGKDLPKEDIAFLERNFAQFKQTNKADTYAEVVLLKEICHTMLRVEKMRTANDPDLPAAITALRMLMKESNLTPKEQKAGQQDTDIATFGTWIQDIERYEPAQWLKSDPRGEIYRDAGNTEEYFDKYIRRPTKNFILQSKDFNVGENEEINDEDLGEVDEEIKNILKSDE